MRLPLLRPDKRNWFDSSNRFWWKYVNARGATFMGSIQFMSWSVLNSDRYYTYSPAGKYANIVHQIIQNSMYFSSRKNETTSFLFHSYRVSILRHDTEKIHIFILQNNTTCEFKFHHSFLIRFIQAGISSFHWIIKTYSKVNFR